ncbi:MAG: hypothetical protein P0S94_05195 [Simkaniaceae bacterium]|nr:hypothetical protein [Simkaniaceae bacterium]
MKKRKAAITIIANIGYILGSLSLFGIGIWIAIYALYSIYCDMHAGIIAANDVLDEVGLIVFSIAIIDVSKYIMVEEVLHGRKEERPHEARRSFSRIAIIIATAISIEGLVLTIQTAKTDLTQIYYPISLLITSALMIVGLGIYQKLNSVAEKD